MTADIGAWIAFGAIVLVMLVIDLRMNTGTAGSATPPSVRHAALWSGVWIGVGLAFSLGILARFGSDAAVTYLTAYLLATV